jgi:hypothetical protein
MGPAAITPALMAAEIIARRVAITIAPSTNLKMDPRLTINQTKRNRPNHQAREWARNAVTVQDTPTNLLPQRTKGLELITPAMDQPIKKMPQPQARQLERSLREGQLLLLTPIRVLMESERKIAMVLHILRRRIPGGRGSELLERYVHRVLAFLH